MRHGIDNIPGIYFGDIKIFPKIPQKLSFTPSSAYITDYEEQEIIVNVDTDVKCWNVIQEVGDFYEVTILNSTQFKIKFNQNDEQTFRPRIGIIGFYVGKYRYSYYQIKQKSKYYFKIDTLNPYSVDYTDDDITSIIDTNVNYWHAEVIKGADFCSITNITTNSITTHIAENKTSNYRIGVIKFSAFGDEEALQFKIGQEMAQGEKDFKIYSAIDAQAQTKEYIVRQVHSTNWYAEVSPYSTRTPILTTSGNKLLINFSAFSGEDEAISIINVYPKIGEKPVELLFMTVGDVPPVPGKHFTINPSGPFTAYSAATNIPINISQQGYDGWSTRIISANRACSISPVGGTSYNIVLGEYSLMTQTSSVIDFIDANGSVITSIIINNLPGGGDKYFNILTNDLIINENAQTVVFNVEQVGYDGWTFDVINNLRPYANKFVGVSTANIVFEAYDGIGTTNAVIFKDGVGNVLGQRTITTQPAAKSFEVVEGDKVISGTSQKVTYTVKQTGYDNNWEVEVQSAKRTYSNIQKTNNSYSIVLNEYEDEDTTTILIFKPKNAEPISRTITTKVTRKFLVTTAESIYNISPNANISIHFTIKQQGYNGWTKEIVSPNRNCIWTKQSDTEYTLTFDEYTGNELVVTNIIFKDKNGNEIVNTKQIITTKPLNKDFSVTTTYPLPIDGDAHTVELTVNQIGYDGWNVTQDRPSSQINRDCVITKLGEDKVKIYFDRMTNPSDSSTILNFTKDGALLDIFVITTSIKYLNVTPRGIKTIGVGATSIEYTVNTDYEPEDWHVVWETQTGFRERTCSNIKVEKLTDEYKVTLDIDAYNYTDNSRAYVLFIGPRGEELVYTEVYTEPSYFDVVYDFSTTREARYFGTLSARINQQGYNGWTSRISKDDRGNTTIQQTSSGVDITFEATNNTGKTIIDFIHNGEIISGKSITFTTTDSRTFEIDSDKLNQYVNQFAERIEIPVTVSGYNNWGIRYDFSGTRPGIAYKATNPDRVIVDFSETSGDTFTNYVKVYKDLNQPDGEFDYLIKITTSPFQITKDGHILAKDEKIDIGKEAGTFTLKIYDGVGIKYPNWVAVVTGSLGRTSVGAKGGDEQYETLPINYTAYSGREAVEEIVTIYVDNNKTSVLGRFILVSNPGPHFDVYPQGVGRTQETAIEIPGTVFEDNITYYVDQYGFDNWTIGVDNVVPGEGAATRPYNINRILEGSKLTNKLAIKFEGAMYYTDHIDALKFYKDSAKTILADTIYFKTLPSNYLTIVPYGFDSLSNTKTIRDGENVGEENKVRICAVAVRGYDNWGYRVNEALSNRKDIHFVKTEHTDGGQGDYDIYIYFDNIWESVDTTGKTIIEIYKDSSDTNPYILTILTTPSEKIETEADFGIEPDTGFVQVKISGSNPPLHEHAISVVYDYYDEKNVKHENVDIGIGKVIPGISGTQLLRIDSSYKRINHNYRNIIIHDAASDYTHSERISVTGGEMNYIAIRASDGGHAADLQEEIFYATNIAKYNTSIRYDAVGVGAGKSYRIFRYGFDDWQVKPADSYGDSNLHVEKYIDTTSNLEYIRCYSDSANTSTEIRTKEFILTDVTGTINGKRIVVKQEPGVNLSMSIAGVSTNNIPFNGSDGLLTINGMTSTEIADAIRNGHITFDKPDWVTIEEYDVNATVVFAANNNVSSRTGALTLKYYGTTMQSINLSQNGMNYIRIGVTLKSGDFVPIQIGVVDSKDKTPTEIYTFNTKYDSKVDVKYDSTKWILIKLKESLYFKTLHIKAKDSNERVLIDLNIDNISWSETYAFAMGDISTSGTGLLSYIEFEETVTTN